MIQPVPDLDNVHYLLMIGANPAVSGMSVVQVPRTVEALQNIRKRGGELVVVDPRRTETAKLASEHLFIRPDTDCFFLLSLLWVLIEQGRVDARWVEADPEGFAALVRHQQSIQRLVVQAFAERSRKLLLQALLMDPASPAGASQTERMMDTLLGLQAAYLPGIR